MKNIILITTFLLSAESVYAVECQVKKNQSVCLDEYQDCDYEDDLLPHEQEYAQHVCDTVKPPKPSAITALFTNIGCTLLVYYISLKTKAAMFFSECINKINQLVYAYAQKRKA